ncbi:hypothetical protein ABCR94_38895 [Streptomyces sp. 21So2-11]|uniref:hypothetical protein n=1 Tax=Streptomyces sp. 21So2-11 TaxID=3144408 RepID=UPI00321BC656
MRDYRWISYMSQNIPGNTSFTLGRHASLGAARNAYAEFCNAVGTDECSMTLYPFSEQNWKDAEEFKEAGCVGYPSRIIERGPLGGVRVVEA